MGGRSGYQKNGTYMAGGSGNEKNRGGGRGKINTNEGSGHWHICNWHVYMHCIRSFSQKTPSPHLFHAPSANTVIADTHRDVADAGDAPHPRGVSAAVVAWSSAP